ncbi:hypothetical protein D3C72_2436830 [compost metagenome]
MLRDVGVGNAGDEHVHQVEGKPQQIHQCDFPAIGHDDFPVKETGRVVRRKC